LAIGNWKEKAQWTVGGVKERDDVDDDGALRNKESYSCSP
jgi:hypothetical protein